MAAPLLHSAPWLMMWSGSPSRLTSLPSLTLHTMPQPQEQKLQMVVTFLVPASLDSGVAAWACGAATPKSAIASPAPAVSFSQSLLFMAMSHRLHPAAIVRPRESNERTTAIVVRHLDGCCNLNHNLV